MKIEITPDEMIALLKYFQKQDTHSTEDLAKEVKEAFPKKMQDMWIWTNRQSAAINVGTTLLKG